MGTFPVTAQGNALATPGGKPLSVPAQALAEAIAKEWADKKTFNAGAMPLTALAYTAIDRIAPAHESVVESLLIYIDTDTLCYRSNSSDQLRAQQDKEWGRVLEWAEQAYGVTWHTTQGVMPLEQPEALHRTVAARLEKLDEFHLAAMCVLASGLSSLALALAALEHFISAETAFRLSRLEEDAQAEIWGRDVEAERRANRLKQEIIDAAHFLRLLDEA